MVKPDGLGRRCQAAVLLALLGLVRANHGSVASPDTWSYTPPALSTGPRRYEGIFISFLFPDFIAHGLDGNGTFFVDRIRDFCDETGTSAMLTGKPFPTAYRTELDTDLGSTNLYDVFNFFGSWMPALARDGKLLKLTEYVRSSADIAWSDILPRVRKGVAEYQNEIYMLPADGDVIVMIYRKDLLDLYGLAKPETWEDFLAVSEYFRQHVGPNAWVENGRTLAQEGGRGACVMTKIGDWAYANLFAFLATWFQAHGPQQGVFLDPTSFEPIMDTPAGREALRMWKQIVLSSSFVERPCQDNDCSSGGSGLDDMVEDMQLGKCMMGLNYMGPVKFIASGAFNTQNSTIALAQVPGSTRVKQLDGGDLVDCNASPINCPYSVTVPKNVNGKPPANGETHLINRATYFSGGGQSWAVNNYISDTLKKDAIWEFLKSMITGDNAVLSTTAASYLLDPFRQSTLDGLQVQGHQATLEFMRNGWQWEQLGTMKSTLDTVFNDLNGVFDLKIIRGDLYIEATDTWMLSYYRTNLTLDAAIAGIAADWKSRTEVISLAFQRNIYRSVLGLPTIQLDCPAGFESMTGTCERCPPGKFKGTNGSDLCEKCEVSTYQPEEGALDCLPCGPILNGSTTTSRGEEVHMACVCPAGAVWIKASPNATPRCERCIEGWLCGGGGAYGRSSTTNHTPALQDERYASAEPEFAGAWPAWTVHCRNKERCPKGLPIGSCPENAEGRACDQCRKNTYRDGDSCKICEGGGSAFTGIAVLLGACAALAGLYFMSTRPPSAMMSSGMTVMLTAGLSIAAIQALGAFSKLSIQWVEPIKSMTQVLEIFTFKVDFVRPSCYLGVQSPAIAYLSSVMVYPAFAVTLRLVFCLAGWCTKKVIHGYQVFNAQGVVIMAAYLSLTMVSVLPWQCESNPDGSSSIVAYRGVRCGTSEWGLMMVFSILATLAYVVSFLGLVTWAILQYPSRVRREGGMEFIRQFNFLFARFTPGRYYYSLIFLLRNMLLALLPVMLVNTPEVQIMLMALVITVTGMLQSRFWPWRTAVANYVDAALSVALSLILVAGALLLAASAESNGMIQIFMIGIGSAAVFCVTIIIGINVFHALRPPKRFGIFLSHHKVGAAVLARWFKMLLSERTTDRVFLDSDDVSDLDKIIDTVANDTKNVMVLLTRETLERMWCAGEIATGMRHGITVVLVQCDDFDGLTDEFLARVPDLWTEAQKCLLASAGLEIQYIQDCYQKLRELPVTMLKRFESTKMQEKAVRIAFGHCTRLSGQAMAGHMTTSFGKANSQEIELERRHAEIQVLGSVKDPEASCICRVLKVYLQEELQTGVSIAIEGDQDFVSEHSFDHCRFLLVVLTKGVLEATVFSKALAWANGVRKLTLIPVRADESFVYPDAQFYADLASGGIVTFTPSANLMPKDIEAAYRALFNKLAMRFTTHSSEKIQAAEVKMMARHLQIAQDDRHADDGSRDGTLSATVTALGSKSEGSKDGPDLNMVTVEMREPPDPKGKAQKVPSLNSSSQPPDLYTAGLEEFETLNLRVARVRVHAASARAAQTEP